MNDKSNHFAVTGKSRLVRPRYSPGLLLQDDDLTQAVDYSRELNRLLLQALFGCGVVCGLKVTLYGKDACVPYIAIAPGMALDGDGEPVHVTGELRIPLDTSCGTPPQKALVVIKRTEDYCMSRDLDCASDDDGGDKVSTRVFDGVEIRLVDESQKPFGCRCVGKDTRQGGAANANAGQPAGANAGAPANAQAAANANANPPVFADPDNECYKKHYAGDCDCGCKGNWVVLGRFVNLDSAMAEAKTKKDGVDADHSVRRFIRPVLMRDPLSSQA